ncbi:type 2 periplasmic-binding domain-containing protein [Paenibacillus roseipurpureus]|uniref:Extracellular solute-binding protein n=1 Tax=Paenibacillus roseopurpureus TaxID=2918901 RepID=A0AA96LSI7_9BACL|nr:extracellular solute-binding protein [Paenibacillus sp. MBLB1832]WNR45264.1 extracellular solute-binding protein [Paenibacillus sp. MBLB1832]
MAKRKASILAIAATMAFGSLLAACSSSTTQPEGEKKAKETKSAEAKGPTAFSMVMEGRGKYLETITDVNNDKFVKKLAELTNTAPKIELILQKDYEQKLILKFSSGDIPDVVMSSGGGSSIYGKELAGAVQSNVFMPLDDLLKEYGQNLLKKIPAAAWDRVKYKGQIVAIPEFVSIPNTLSTYIRKDYLDKAGLQPPKTVDEYLTMFRAFKKNGVEQPFLALDKFNLSDQFFGAYDVLPNQFELQGDQVVPKFFKVDAMMKALQTYKTLLDEGLMSKEFPTNNGNNLAQNVYSAKTGMYMLGAKDKLNIEKKLKAAIPDGSIIQTLAPTGPDGKGGSALGQSINRTYLINKKVSKDKAIGIIKFFDWMLTDDADKFFTYGIEGDTYKTENGKVNYKIAETPDEINVEEFRQKDLWFVKDNTFTKSLILNPLGAPVIDFMKNTLTKEGRDSIIFDPQLDSLVKNPDLNGAFPPLLVGHMVKMIYSQEPISDWPKVIEEYKKKGGDLVIKEATDRYNKKEGVYLPRK